MKNYFFGIIALIAFATSVLAQPFFQRNDSIKVTISGNDLDNPWAGGLNYTQTSNFDLNLDGIQDLFIFDRTGNKVRTFLNKGNVGSSDFVYAPEYESKIPELHDWALLADYNCDGKMDIFSYSDNGGGVMVYKNISSLANGLQFVIEKPLVYSKYNPPNGSLINLYISSVDIPAIADIDGDGDLDIATFAITGTYMEYHINKSKELYGICDSLVYEMKNRCWGYASEHPFNNSFSLQDTCFGNVANPQIEKLIENAREGTYRHSGSCELCIDLNGDGDKDIIVGDISANNLTMLTNGGTPTNGFFVAVDTAFPFNNGGSPPVNLTVSPCAYYADVNTDGIKDLIVSPSAPNVSENFNSTIYYENTGTNNFPVFQYQQSDFLQDNMIEVGEGAYPALFDYNNDGLIDLFIGNYGYYNSPNFENKIAYFKNIGTATVPHFELVTRDFNNYSSLGMVNMIPAFGDMDGDGDGDLVIGGYDGKLHYFENTAAVGAQANFVLTQVNMINSSSRVIDVGDFAAPQIVDINGDGLKDLLIGARNGKLAYYERTSATGLPILDSMTHFFGNIKVNQPGYITGYSFPFAYKNAGKTEILLGSELGYLRRYDNIDGNLSGTFNLVDSTFLNIRIGSKTAPVGIDINNDTYWDLFVGNYAGGVSFYKGNSTSLTLENSNLVDWSVELYPNPADNEITIKVENYKNRTFEVKLYNMVGQMISSYQLNENLLILPTEVLNQGVYICNIAELNNEGKSTSITVNKKIVIKH